jgi:uncharacterized protein YlzI (FlbEa/FlbD family)
MNFNKVIVSDNFQEQQQRILEYCQEVQELGKNVRLILHFGAHDKA